MLASEIGAGLPLLDFLKPPFATFQDFVYLTIRSVKNLFGRPRYWNDVLMQMDIMGVGSLPIVALIGGFSGIVMALQMSKAISQYGAASQTGTFVAITLVRELGPVLTAVIVAGRNGSGIASELGSMKVTEQIDAMRALGTDPSRKLITPRMLALAIVLPLLTIIADFVGLCGGYLIGATSLNISAPQYWNSAQSALDLADIAQGLLKPFLFSFAISLVGCYYGMKTSGGTQGVGHATTQAVVVASVWIFILDVLITQIFVSI
jgi:phospholipid/cholesterol/gamma-HCH transport system permease protein